MAWHSADISAALLPLPLDAEHWQAIVRAMGLSPRQAEITELVARGATQKEIAFILKMSLSTVRTQQDRIFHKTETRGRSELLIHILGVSHRVGYCSCRKKGERDLRDTRTATPPP